MWSFLGFEEEPVDRRTSKHTHLNDTVENDKTIEEALECDYERDCTNLYKYIEEENWVAISKFLETGYWPGNFFADTIPPADQVRTWVTRFDSNNGDRVRWSQLPLHLAIVVEAPYEIIGSLIELYPQAVRCTDDQHMLPLHLAMRHGAHDNIVDLLLAAFPEAVNAKGKNDRTPIDCAIRGPNKLRGRILGTFVERSKAKATKSISSSYTKELSSLRSKLEDKESELGDVKSKLAAVDTAKAALELDLTSKIDELSTKNKDISQSSKEKLSDMEKDRLLGELEIQKKISALEQEKMALELAQTRAREEEKDLIDALEKVQLEVAESASPEDLKALKQEIDNLKASRLKSSQEKAKLEVEELKKHIADELSKADGQTREELKAMHANIEQLHRVTSLENGTTEDMTILKGEVEGLRYELKQKDEASRMKLDLALLRESLEIELKDSETKTQEQITAIEKALSSLKMSDLETKTNEELLELKKELETLKEDVKERKLADKMTEDVVKLRRRVADLSKSSSGRTKQELGMMKKTLDAIKVAELQSKSSEELLTLNKDLKVLKDQLKEAEEATKMRNELTELKKRLEVELKEARDNKKGGTAPIKAAIQKIQKLDSKSKFELVALKFELESIQEEIKAKQELRSVKTDVASLKTELNKHLQSATGKTKSELTSIKIALEKIDTKKIDPKKIDDVNAAKSQLSNAKKRLADQELAMLLKSELRDLRKSLDAEMRRTPNGPSKKDAAKLKSMLADLSEKQLDAKTTQELIPLKEEASSFKQALKEKEKVFKDIETIKITLDELLLKKEGKAKQDLLIMKKTVDAIDLQDLDANSEKEWEELKAQIDILRKELEKADIADRTKQDLANLKEALNTAIADSKGSSKGELTKLKVTVDAIDVSKLDSSKHEEWEELKTEIDALKKELKAKECESLLSSVKDKLKQARGLDKIEKSRITGRFEAVNSNFADQSSYELADAKRELESILEDIPSPKDQHRSFRLSTPRRSPKKANASPTKPSPKKTNAPPVSASPSKESISSTASSPRKGLFNRFKRTSSSKTPSKITMPTTPEVAPKTPEKAPAPKTSEKEQAKPPVPKSASKDADKDSPAPKKSSSKDAEKEAPAPQKSASKDAEKEKEPTPKKSAAKDSGKEQTKTPATKKSESKEEGEKVAKKSASKDADKALKKSASKDADKAPKKSASKDADKAPKTSASKDADKAPKKSASKDKSSAPKKSKSKDEQESKEKKAPVVETVDDRDAMVAEEKKEDEPRSLPPLPAKPKTVKKDEKGMTKEEMVIQRTQSKTLISPDGEIETVVVE